MTHEKALKMLIMLKTSKKVVCWSIMSQRVTGKTLNQRMLAEGQKMQGFLGNITILRTYFE